MRTYIKCSIENDQTNLVEFRKINSVLSMTMHSVLVSYFLVSLSVTVLASMNNGGEPGEIIAELPTQPIVFNTPDELRTYLQELDKYFAIVGRPRFGRTSGSGYPRNVYPYIRANSVPSDIF
ncbi:hypothetical protein JTE90_028279 [Oedothorax gibbosus]|uniref:Neuropeptide Y n=1 Tax=Oedothorax gibbosus TaxID=931172 RepID=A0AAV6UES0_9ARAC|nr:hypothetical protein JTE90_028279 [Oedothorax gibbosus]